MFRGNHPARVDEKGRLKVPADFKRRVDELYGPQFFITSRDGKRAEIYPMKEWEKIEEGIAKAPASGAKRKFLDVTNYYGQVVEMDGQGRLLIPQVLRGAAVIEGDVAVLGQQTFLAVVNDQKHKAALEAEPLTDADIEALGVIGL
ncbi:division/cell wall cluster transcriptional repressor MraZ [Granulicella cerasi]|uniref:Transcriptional regulator MraZ n=1 Tax=Granulicella cerasi TaxID=741063 RepID=A0ABW1ZDX5_9BACT|nr:division/cell wall cluster transcriptional repressor MraZ [Granulicella cerasi]